MGWTVTGTLLFLSLIGVIVWSLSSVGRFIVQKRYQFLGGVCFLLTFLIVGVIYVLFFPFSPKEKAEYVYVTIEQGMSVHRIADTLKTHSLIRSRGSFLWAARILGYSRELKAGYYRLQKGLSNYEILRILKEGRVVPIRVTIPEGLTVQRIAGILQRRLPIDSARFVTLAFDSNFCQRVGIEAPNLEGYLFPATYDFYWGMSEEAIIQRMVRAFKRAFSDSLRQRAKELGFSVREILTLASIIEGEALLDSERVYISAVYHNRLRRGMLLQADPTIQYLLGGKPRRLLKRHLEIDSPYNTYKYPGLPPGPINNPGLKSILAALYPADVDYLYFVALGDGSHAFTTRLRDHLRAKTRLDRLRREYYGR